MTISQTSSNQAPALAKAASAIRSAHRRLLRWHERRHAQAELARLARAGDHLLRDLGLDPIEVRQNPDGVLDRIARRRPVRAGPLR